MSDNNLILSLGKVIIAAAWADGQITNDERNCLKDLIFRMPDITGRQWDELEIYMDSPVGDAERNRLVAELQNLTATSEQRNLATATLNQMVEADGAVTDEERRIVTEITQALQSSNPGVWGSFSRMLIGRRNDALAGAPNREIYLDDFTRNRVYYRARQRLQESGRNLDLPDVELRRLSLAGGLMALVARVSSEVSESEFAAIYETFVRHFGLTPEQATFVAEVATSDDLGDLDFYRLVREFSEAYPLEERQQFVKALFAVAAADGKASYEETEQIRLIAQGLKLTHREFIEAKMTLPAERR